MNTRDLLASGLDLVKQQASAVASTVSLAKPYLPAKLTEMNTGDIAAGLSYVKDHTAAMVSTRAVGTAAMVIGGALGAYILWRWCAAAAPAAAGVMMKAPGAAGFLISRAAFLANPQVYYNILRTAGPKDAAAAFV